MSEPECVVKVNNLLGESPIWSVERQALFWIDVRNPMIHRFVPATGKHDKWTVETEIGSIGLAQDGKLIAGLRTGFGLYDLETNTYEVIADPEGEGRLNTVRMNDGKVDRAGRYWCGSMEDPGQSPVGTLYRLDTDRSCHAVEGEIRIPNSLCWSPDSRTMYFADSRQHTIWAHDYDLETGAMTNRRVFVEVEESLGVPDGATVDAEGFVWSAQMFGGRVTRYDPDGKAERVVELPVPQITCCAFGGADMDVLYITTASVRMNREDLAAQPLAGGLFTVDVGIKGLPEPEFLG